MNPEEYYDDILSPTNPLEDLFKETKDSMYHPSWNRLVLRCKELKISEEKIEKTRKWLIEIFEKAKAWYQQGKKEQQIPKECEETKKLESALRENKLRPIDVYVGSSEAKKELVFLVYSTDKEKSRLEGMDGLSVKLFEKGLININEISKRDYKPNLEATTDDEKCESTYQPLIHWCFYPIKNFYIISISKEMFSVIRNILRTKENIKYTAWEFCD